MKKFRFLPLMALTALLAIGAMAPLAQASGGAAVVRTAVLKGSAAFPAVDGKATFKRTGDERELQVEIEDANRLAGRLLNVFIAGKKVGSMRVNSLGNASLNKNTERGQFVPFVKAGQRINVRTQTGTLVAFGVFRNA